MSYLKYGIIDLYIFCRVYWRSYRKYINYRYKYKKIYYPFFNKNYFIYSLYSYGLVSIYLNSLYKVTSLPCMIKGFNPNSCI